MVVKKTNRYGSTKEAPVQAQFVSFRDLAPEIPSTTYATFALHRYPAKFIPQVISYALKTYARPSMSVFDPFAGYGTVGPVASLCGNHYELWDLNPLIEDLQAVAVSPPVDVDTQGLVRAMASNKAEFWPDWKNLGYWYPECFLELLAKAWGFYRNLEDKQAKLVLLVPLLKASRYFSYNDDQRQKLSRSPVATKRVEQLLRRDRREVFFGKISEGVDRVLRSLREYHALAPGQVDAVVKGGVDSLSFPLQREHDLLLTSPPYLQAQEYIRGFKLDLFWTGQTEEKVRALAKTEIPYRHVEPCPIYSSTYQRYLDEISEPHMRAMFQRYFFGVLGSLTTLQEKVRRYLLLFVGPATVRGIPIPLAQIFTEHFTALGWQHTATLVDTIVSRAMFFYQANPATGQVDQRMSTEHLVVLQRK